MAVPTDRIRLADGLNRSREAAAMLTGVVASLSGVPDPQARHLAEASLESVSMLEARLQLLDQAYEIAARHLAQGLPVPVVRVVQPKEPEGAVVGLTPGFVLKGSR